MDQQNVVSLIGRLFTALCKTLNCGSACVLPLEGAGRKNLMQIASARVTLDAPSGSTVP